MLPAYFNSSATLNLSLGITFIPAELVPIAMDFLYLELPMFMTVFNSRYATLNYRNII